MSASHEENWPTATNPRHLLKRVRPSGRQYTLLACAVVRHLIPGPRTEMGTRILDALERFAVVQPRYGVRTHLWNGVVRKQVPEVSEPTDSRGWLYAFRHHMGALSRVCAADVNAVLELALAPDPLRREAYREAQELAAELLTGSPAAPAGWLDRMLGTVVPPSPQLRLAGAKFRHAVLARLPDAQRATAEAEWPSDSAGHSPWQRGLAYLTRAREVAGLAELNASACELIREIFGNPFRPPAIDPAWLAWNHGAVRHIAEQIVTSGDFADLPILADALEDAGCCDVELLGHCRAGAAHVPGCWALDAVLGK